MKKAKQVFFGIMNPEIKMAIVADYMRKKKRISHVCIDNAEIAIFEDKIFQNDTLHEAFKTAVNRGIEIKHFTDYATKERLFSIALTSCPASWSDVSGPSREREHVIYRSAISVFLIRCGVHESEVAVFVCRDRSNMFHYLRIHEQEMKQTPLYAFFFEKLIAML